jgi:thymidylate kinase
VNPEDTSAEPYQLELERWVRLPRFADREASGPFVVAIEGANGAGKTTLCRALSASLRLPTCLGTDEAWFSEPFKVRMIRDAQWHASAMFFLSGCFEQMRVLRDRPEPMVILDRSLWSTLAVHAATSRERIEALLAMLNPVARDIRVPDLTLVLEASFETCQARIARKTGTARALDELTANAPFHSRERGFYRWLGRHQAAIQFLDVNHRDPRQAVEAACALIRESAPC